MSNARDDRDRLEPDKNSKKRRNAAFVVTPSEEIGQMHFSSENYSTALEYFQKALRASDLKDFPDRFRLNLRVGDCYRQRGNYRDARKFLERARVLLPENAPSAAVGKLEYREAYILRARGNYDEALKLGFSAYRRLKKSDEHNEVADIQLLLAICYWRLGQNNEAEEFFMDALSSYRRIEDKIGIAYVYNNLGLLHKNACRWNRALASLSKSLDLAKSLGLTQHLIRVHLNLGVVYAKLRRFSDALSAFSNAANMAERFGDQEKLTKAIFMQGRTYVQTGEFCKAEKYILRGQTMANEYGYARESALTDEYLGELMIARGRYEEALVNLNKGIRKAKSIAPGGDMMAEMMRRIADVQHAMGNHDGALKMIEEGLQIADSCGEYYEIGYFYRTQGLSHKRLGDDAKAAASLRTSVEMFEKFENPYEKHCSQQQLGRLQLRQRDQKSHLQAKQILSDSIIGFGKLEESGAQMMSHVLLGVVEEKLGNLDDALLAIYEADRLAEEEQDTRLRKVLHTMRVRVEGKMTRDTKKVLEQIPMFGDIQSSSKSRDKLVAGLGASLKLIIEKLDAGSGFVAIPRASGKGFDVACRENLSKPVARALAVWHAERTDSGGPNSLRVFDADREPGLDPVRDVIGSGLGTFLFQKLGFEGENFGVIFVHQGDAANHGPIGQEALHFVAAYSRLISLSVYELLRNEKRQEYKPKPSASGFESIVTDNNDMIKLLNLAERVAHSNATVLLQGETGTGKGLIAYAIHLLSQRRDKGFVHINCAAMPESLLESELFGHVKGAFTGAIADKEGLLRQADGGTIFLDEIGKTSLTMQGKLLQFLDNGKVRKVGSNDLMPVDVRVICASKSNLMQLCDEGRFLEDFFYRINDFPLTVPPLRKRPEDIPLLFFHYLRKFSREMEKDIVDISDEAMELLRSFRWAGNVRELEKVVKRAIILADKGEQIEVAHLPSEVIHAPKNGGGNGKIRTLRDRIQHLEKQEILAALERSGWNKSRASVELGVSYPSLLSKIKRYNIRSY